MSAPAIVVAGGGAIGLGIAWRSAAKGLEVMIADADVGRGASWAAAGMLAPVTEAHYGEEPLLQLNLASAETFGDWVAELQDVSGINVGYRRTGTLLVARDADENAQLEELYRFQQRQGLAVERLKSKECREAEPALASDIRGGILVAGDHQVDNRAMVRALIEACKRSGVEFDSANVKAIIGGGAAEGVILENGRRIHSGSVVIAAGPWSNKIEGLARDALPPVHPLKGQLLHLRSRRNASLPDRTVRGVDVYVVPRADGRLIVGATMEDQGFDTTITAGAVYTLLRDAYELFPGVAEFELQEVACGLRPATPDNAPVLGPTVVPGLVAATGHSRNGILLTPITAELISDYLVDGRVPDILAAFAPERFAHTGRAAS
jgi:glycine oxidase